MSEPILTFQLPEQIDHEITAANNVIRRARHLAAKLLPQLRGRLRTQSIDGDTLAELKRELEDFDLRGNKWRRRS